MELHHDERTRSNRPQSILIETVLELLEEIITHVRLIFAYGQLFSFLINQAVVHEGSRSTFDQLKSLRLVGRCYNYATAPRVLYCIRICDQDACHEQLEMEYDTCRLCILFRDMRNWCKSASGLILNFTVVPLACLLTIIFAPHMVRLCIYDSVSRLRTRYHFSWASVLNMPNVRRFV